jgi:hypothetical protein
MNIKQRRRYEMLGRVHAFGAAHAENLPTGTLGPHLFAVVGDCVRDAERGAMGQLPGQCRSATTSKAAARKALWQSLDAIRRTARALALDIPGLDQRFRLPRGNGDRRLLNAARAFALDARESAAMFVAHGLRPTFLEDLAARIDGFECAIANRGQSRVDRICAGVGLRASLESAFLAVRRLDAVVPNLLGDDPAAMASWRKARHVVRPAPPRSTDARHDSKDQRHGTPQLETHLVPEGDILLARGVDAAPGYLMTTRRHHMMAPVIASTGKLSANADHRIFTPSPANDPTWSGPIHLIT